MRSVDSSPVDVLEHGTQFKPLSDDDETLWDAIEIIKEKQNLYLVRWDGKDPATDKPWKPSWVPKHDCTNDLIRDWKLKRAMKFSRKKLPSEGDTSTSRTRSSKPRFPSSKRSPVVEIMHPKKRPREAPRYDVETVEEYAGDDLPNRKKRKLESPLRHMREEEEEEEEEGEEIEKQKEERRQQMKINEVIHSTAPQNKSRKQHTTAQSQGIASGNVKSADRDDVHLVHDSQDAQHQDSHQDYGESMNLNHTSQNLNTEATPPSLPSPRALLFDVVVPETQSPHVSPQPHLNMKHKPAAQLCANDTHRVLAHGRSKSVPREVHPVPVISPTIFRKHLSTSDAKPDSQASEIGSFISPRKSMSHKRRKKRPTNSMYSEDGNSGSEDREFPNGTHDPIQDDESLDVDYDALLRRKGQQLAAAQRGKAPVQRKRPLSEILANRSSAPPKAENGDSVDDGGHGRKSNKSAVNVNGARTRVLSKPSQGIGLQLSKISSDADEEDDVHLSHERLHPEDQQAIKDASSSEAMDLSQGFLQPSLTPSLEHTEDITDHLQEVIYADVDDLRPEDAPDAYNDAPGRPDDIDVLSGKPMADFSLDVAAPWTQKSYSYWQLASIKSPTKHLDKALGLLHRKSEEIEKLDNDGKALKSKILNLEASLVVATKKYDQVNVELETERAQQAAADSEQLTKLLQENERLNVMNKTLESDKDLLRGLYGRASDAHQTILAENNALVRDNQSLREQATTGVKQAGAFWKNQVQTLETDLARVRGTVKVLTDQAQRTDNDVRRRAGLLPVAQKATMDALEEVERLKDHVRELGRENTRLRIQVKDWEDDAMARRRKEMDAKRREEDSTEEQLVWVCQWIDAERQAKCAAVLQSREELREHVYKVGHL